MKTRFIQIFVLISLISIMPGSALSQTLYSLYDLTQLASQHSQSIKIAQDDLVIAQLDKKRALSVLIPSATVYGSILERRNADFYTPDSVSLGGKLTQSFTLNGKELIAFDISKQLIESKTFSLESVKSQYILAVAQAYYNILSAQRNLEIAQSDVQRLQTYKDSVNEKLNVGNVTKTDLFRAEAELSRSKTDEISAYNNVLKSKAALANLVDIKEHFTLEKKTAPRIQNYHSTLDDIRDTALKNRSEIKTAKKSLAIAEKTIALQKSDYWPTLSLDAGYRETDIEYSISGGDLDYDIEDLYISAEISFTLYDGGLRKATILQAVAAHRQARNALELEEKQIILESKNAFYDYENAKRALINLADEIKSAQENYNAVQMQFQYGMADTIDTMDANTFLVSAQRRNTTAQYIYYLSVLNILYTKGELLEFLSQQGS